MNDLELSVISLLWFDESNKHLDDVTDDLFNDKETIRLLNAVKTYRKDNTHDLVLSYEKMGQVDTTTLRAGLDRCGGMAMYDTYLKELRRKNIIRHLSMIDINSSDNTEAIKDLTTALEKLKSRPDNIKIYDLGKDLVGYAEDLERRRKGDYERYSLGVDFLDKNFGYLLPGCFLAIGALHGTGKSNLTFKLFTNLVRRNIKCVYFSSEMSYCSIVDRFISINSEMNAFKIRQGSLDDDEFKEALQVLNDKISYKPGNIVVTGRFDINMLKDIIKILGAKFIFIDFLQQFRFQASSHENRTAQVTEMAAQLKEIAVDMGIVVVGLSQINKDSDLKDARALEEKADIVMKMSTVSECDETKVILFNITKNRYGTTNHTEFAFDKNNCNFKEMGKEKSAETYKQKEIYGQS